MAWHSRRNSTGRRTFSLTNYDHNNKDHFK